MTKREMRDATHRQWMQVVEWMGYESDGKPPCAQLDKREELKHYRLGQQAAEGDAWDGLDLPKKIVEARRKGESLHETRCRVLKIGIDKPQPRRTLSTLAGREEPFPTI